MSLPDIFVIFALLTFAVFAGWAVSGDLNILPFGHVKHCPKCTMGSFWFVREYLGDSCTEMTCTNCRYSWYERSADWKAEASK